MRYNSTTGQLEQSISGGPYFELLPTTSVISFGAKCDGITNDAVAFQNAINAVQATGGTLSIPHGTCIICAALTLGTTPIRIIGDGLRSTILKAGAVINAMFQFADLADNTFFQFFDFAIDGNVETNYGIISARANHTLMVRLRIQQPRSLQYLSVMVGITILDSLEIATTEAMVSTSRTTTARTTSRTSFSRTYFSTRASASIHLEELGSTSKDVISKTTEKQESIFNF